MRRYNAIPIIAVLYVVAIAPARNITDKLRRNHLLYSLTSLTRMKQITINVPDAMKVVNDPIARNDSLTLSSRNPLPREELLKSSICKNSINHSVNIF